MRKGTHRVTGEEVAIKIIDKKIVGDSKEMIATEIEILRRLKHDYIICLKEMFETSQYTYLVMELYVGEFGSSL